MALPNDHGPATDRSPPLVVRHLTVAYQRKPVLWDVSFEAPAGSMVGILGPNGAGKTTLLKAVLDLVPKASGSVELFGRPFRKVRQRVAYVPQRESVDWDFPTDVLDVVTMGLYGRIGWCRPVRRQHRRAACEALEQLGIRDLAHQQINRLSGGQQQRTFLARALVQNADLYLLDEPFAAVDAATEGSIIALLRTLREQGKTVVVIHHDLQTVPQYFDHVVLLNMRVVASGPTQDVFNEPNLTKAYGGRLTLLEEVAEAMRRHGGSR